jgi:putative transposase
MLRLNRCPMTLPLEANDEWQLQHRYMQIEGMTELATPMINPQALAITPQAS